MLLDRLEPIPDHHRVVNGDRMLLSDAVDPVGGLILLCGVPKPGVSDDMGRPGELSPTPRPRGTGSLRRTRDLH